MNDFFDIKGMVGQRTRRGIILVPTGAPTRSASGMSKQCNTTRIGKGFVGCAGWRLRILDPTGIEFWSYENDGVFNLSAIPSTEALR